MECEHGRTKKSYYVKGHEKKEQIEYQFKFCTTCLTEMEPRSHRWISITIDECNKLQLSLEANSIVANGYRYHDNDTGLDMIEFHVDDHHQLQDIASKSIYLERL
jgi:hypothetical protein